MDGLNLQALDAQIRTTEQHMAALRRDRGDGLRLADGGGTAVTDEGLQDLQQMVEELRVARAELLRQHTALVDARRLAERERARYAELFEAAPDPYLVTRPDGLVQQVNRAAAALFGVRAADALVGEPIERLVCRAALSRFRRQFSSLTAGGECAGWSLPMRRLGGGEFPAEMSVSAVWHGGRVEALRWLVRDVSSRRELEEQLVNAANAERERVGQELHDSIQQMLAGTKLYADLLLQKLTCHARPEAEEAGHLARLVGESLEQTRRLSHGLCPLTLGGRDLRLAMYHLACTVNGYPGVACDLRCSDPCRVASADTAGHLYRIAQEGIGNAVRHGRATHIRIRVARTTDHVVLRIIDNGVGLPDDADQGNGLGLRSMRYRAQIIGGSLDIRPGRHRGTVVCCCVHQPPDA